MALVGLPSTITVTPIAHETVSKHVHRLPSMDGHSGDGASIKSVSSMSPKAQSDDGYQHKNGRPVVVPPGWKRRFIDDRIVYISPSQVILFSHDDVMEYLMKDGTCKCGLECPVYVTKIFNFDPSSCLQSTSFDCVSSNSNTQSICHHRRKFDLKNDHHPQLESPPDRWKYVEESPEADNEEPQNLVVNHYQQQEDFYRRHDEFAITNNNTIQANPYLKDGNYYHSEHRVYSPSEVPPSHHSYQQEVDEVHEVPAHYHQHLQGYPNSDHQAGYLIDQNQALDLSNHGSGSGSHFVHRETRHDVTVVTPAITDVIPSVGHLMPGHVHIHHEDNHHMSHHHPTPVSSGQQFLILNSQPILIPSNQAQEQTMVMSHGGHYAVHQTHSHVHHPMHHHPHQQIQITSQDYNHPHQTNFLPQGPPPPGHEAHVHAFAASLPPQHHFYYHQQPTHHQQQLVQHFVPQAAYTTHHPQPFGQQDYHFSPSDFVHKKRRRKQEAAAINKKNKTVAAMLSNMT